MNANETISKDALLDYLPQQKPFRFVDKILSVSDEQIEGQYTFQETETFYPGHFPGNPVTPGVILLESMAQVGVVAFGLYLVANEQGLSELNQWLTLFSDAEVEFLKMVKPNETVRIQARKVMWRRMKLKVEAQMFNENGELVAQATISGLGVRKS